MFKYFAGTVLGMFLSLGVMANMIEDPTTWTYEVKKKGNHEYELVFHLSLKQSWHIWSVNPGGDGFQIPPTFEFDKNPNIQLVGKPTEQGHKTTTIMDGVDGKVTYFSGTVDYVQVVKVKGNGVVKGKHEYQVCNDNMCLPPKTKAFTFDIKE